MDELNYIAQAMKRFVEEFSTETLYDVMEAITEEVRKRNNSSYLESYYTQAKELHDE